MSSDKYFTRREFGCIATACLAGNTLPYGNLFLKSSAVSLDKRTEEISVNRAIVLAVQNIIETGSIGRVYLGYSSYGNSQNGRAVEDIANRHAEQLLLLCEIMQPGQVTVRNSITVPSGFTVRGGVHTLMTTVEFLSGMRIEVTSTSDYMARTGCVIRGDLGSIHIHEDKLELVSMNGCSREDIVFDAHYSCVAPNMYTELVHHILADAQQDVSA